MTGPIADPDRWVCLCDVGAPDYAAAVTVDEYGTEQLWLVSMPQFNTHCDHGNPNQEHERLGRLPGEWRERIWGELARCGRPTAKGRPCRHIANPPGEPCRMHRDNPADLEAGAP